MDSTTTTTTATATAAPDTSNDALPDPVGERFVLQAQEELRLEVPFFTNATEDLSLILQKGSCECWGCELALGKTYSMGGGGLKLALFSWHGCVLDISGTIEISYTSEETDANVAYVNTHAQLEALRDDAMAAIAKQLPDGQQQGPRVMVVGPPESGKTSLCKTLVAYACKVGRTPLWVDLDPNDNSMSVPGSLAVAPMTAAAVTLETYATTGIPPNAGVSPLVIFHGQTSLQTFSDLYRAQVDRLAGAVNARLENDENARASGIIVNTNGWIQDEGFPLLLHAAQSLDISVILILGHDRLYSMLSSHYKKMSTSTTTTTPGSNNNNNSPKILKLPRSGGVVSRPQTFLRHAKSRAVKRYFYGDLVEGVKTTSDSSTTSAGAAAALSSSLILAGMAESSTTNNKTNKVPQLTPFLLQLSFGEVQIYKLASMALSRSLLPVAAQQSTDAVQLIRLDLSGDKDDADSLQHALLAVCHPAAVALYLESGNARDLVTAGVAGFCAVERVLTDTDTLHLLSPCAGALPSKTLLLGDITWME